MDPATVSGLTAVLLLLRDNGPWGLAALVILAVLRVWRSGEFLPKSFVDQVLALKDEQLKELADRYRASQDGLTAWRANSEAALRTAEQAQDRQKELGDLLGVLRQELASASETVRGDLALLRKEVDEAREELHQARAWKDLGPNPLEPQPPQPPPSRTPGRGARGAG